MRTGKLKKHFTRRAAVSAFAALLIAASGATSLAAEAKMLVPVGRAVGIRLESDGVMIVGIPDVCADGETPSPSKRAGFRAGDVITRVGKTEITSGKDLKAAVQASGGAGVAIQIRRGGENTQIEVTPHRVKSGDYSLGLYVRDGISGIGTVTYFDPETNTYGALGHAVNDGETGAKFPVRDGIISRVSVTDVAKGKSGTPGQLHGAFDFDAKLGTINRNTDCGIFGSAEGGALATDKLLEVADESEIHTGAAYILSNISGSEVRRYEAEISRVFRGGEADGRSMLVTVNDEELTAETGGIVQGMSGSPIIQDGKLVGAVTHVLINDPQKGYGVSITKMLESAGANAPALAA
ncbi:MAG: SpoIVB peptidase [Oscillospiraceae bacterium]|jgi:stage IV sporulation protein B|nr:SpoIVB peptidase [Oscillospiraceae bacterium]